MKMIIPFAPISVNNMYFANRQFGKKPEAREWSYQVNWCIAKYEKDFDLLRKEFNPEKHGIKISFTFEYKNFFNKAGTISSRCHDLTNVEKPLLDLILLPDNHGQAPYKSPNLNIDDKYVVELVSKKCLGESDSMNITIEIVSL